uniref:Uncharacterized protein n=1 Tax=Heterorhabditis bacteriophora TaxID=37862 RepID=A0A1I7WY11_HETBA
MQVCIINVILSYLFYINIIRVAWFLIKYSRFLNYLLLTSL